MSIDIEKLFEVVNTRNDKEDFIEISCNTCAEIFIQKSTQAVLGFIYITCGNCRKVNKGEKG